MPHFTEEKAVVQINEVIYRYKITQWPKLGPKILSQVFAHDT